MNILKYISEKIKLFLKKQKRISKVIINEDMNITYIFEIDIENTKEYYKSKLSSSLSDSGVKDTFFFKLLFFFLFFCFL